MYRKFDIEILATKSLRGSIFRKPKWAVVFTNEISAVPAKTRPRAQLRKNESLETAIDHWFKSICPVMDINLMSRREITCHHWFKSYVRLWILIWWADERSRGSNSRATMVQIICPVIDINLMNRRDHVLNVLICT